MLITLDELRRFTVARNFFRPTTLKRALGRMGFVQADPIRAPARAQDLILRHRVRNYHAGDLDRRYATLDVEEDVFVNYGFVTSYVHALMHPRSHSRVPADDVGRPWPAAQRKRAQLLLDFVRDRGVVHPREVDEYFSHGTVKNNWGGSSSATTHLMDAMQYCGLLRVVRRDNGIRIYSVRQESELRGPETKTASTLAPAGNARLTLDAGAEAAANKSNSIWDEGSKTGKRVAEREARIDALVDVVVHIYAPLPTSSLAFYLRRLRYAVPQWRKELMGALIRAKQRLSQARVNVTGPRSGTLDWYWPSDEDVMKTIRENCKEDYDTVRLLAPFDPVVHDRSRFELLWGWVYRLEAYTPAPKRKFGYYAMPILWRDRLIGWGNLAVDNGELRSNFGYVASNPPRDRAFKRELEAELDRIRIFLSLTS